MAYMRLGDLLISAGVISPDQLRDALAIQKQTKERLGDVLISSGIITEQQLIEALQMQLGVDFVDLTAVSIPLELAKFVPRSIAKKYCVVPVKLVKDELYVAMSDPLNFVAQEEIKSASHKQVVPMIATRRATEQAIATLYGNEGTARAIEEMKREAGTAQADIVPVQMSKAVDTSAAEAPTIRFVNSVIERAITESASDIHLEPQEGEMVVRMRIDGVLRRVFTVPANLQATVISRLKIMGGIYRAGTLITGQPQLLHHSAVKAAIGIGKDLQGLACQRFQPPLVLHDFIHGKGRTDGFQGGVVKAVAADFMSGVHALQLLRLDFGYIQRLAVVIRPGIGSAQQRGIEVEGAF